MQLLSGLVSSMSAVSKAQSVCPIGTSTMLICDLPDLFASDRRACGDSSLGTWAGVVPPGVRKRHVHCLSPAISWDLEVDSYKPRCKQSTSTNSDAKANGRGISGCILLLVPLTCRQSRHLPQPSGCSWRLGQPDALFRGSASQARLTRRGRRCRELTVAKGRSEEPISSQASVALVHWKRA